MLESLGPISDILLLEALILGVFSTGGLIFALLLLFGRLQWARRKFRALGNVSLQVLIVGSLLTLFPVYFLGVTTNHVAGIWIDKPSYWHLGLKSWWIKYNDKIEWDDYGDDKADSRIKCARYRRAFSCCEDFCKNENNLDKAREWYYQIYSHIVLMEENENFREYILHSQKQVNLARLWSLVSLVVFVVCLLRLIFLFGRAGLYRMRPNKLSVSLRKSDLCTVLMVVAVAVIIYVASGTVWVKVERETSAKVWRFAKSFPEKATAWEMSTKKDTCLPLESKTAHPKSLSPEI